MDKSRERKVLTWSWESTGGERDVMGRSWWLGIRRVTGQWRRDPAKNEKSKEQNPLDLAAMVFGSCSIREAYYGGRERERESGCAKAYARFNQG